MRMQIGKRSKNRGIPPFMSYQQKMEYSLHRGVRMGSKQVWGTDYHNIQEEPKIVLCH